MKKKLAKFKCLECEFEWEHSIQQKDKDGKTFNSAAVTCKCGYILIKWTNYDSEFDS